MKATITLERFLELVEGNESDILVYKSEKEAIEAVKRNGDALRYVKEQTEEICLEAVKRNGDALRYVDKRVFRVSAKGGSASGGEV